MVNGEVVNFNYPEVVADHQKYRVTVYKHNSLRHDGGTKSQIGLESAWGTTWGGNPSSCIFIACTEVNAYMVMKYFLKMDDSFMNFRKSLAKALITNLYMNERTFGSPESTRKRQILHMSETAPTHATEYN